MFDKPELLLIEKFFLSCKDDQKQYESYDIRIGKEISFFNDQVHLVL